MPKSKVRKKPVPQADVRDQSGVDRALRSRIAEALLLGESAEALAGRLGREGVKPAVAEAEVKRAAESPYVIGAERLRARLKKRDWQLRSYGRLAAAAGGQREVPRAHALPAEAFFRDYYSTNRPVLLTGLIDHWPARTLWSLDYFERKLGEAQIEVQWNRESDPNYEINSNHFKASGRFADVIARLRDPTPTNNFYVTANNSVRNKAVLRPLWDDVGGIDGYLTPREACDGFFWSGPRGTITPFHHDLTNNLLVQIAGRKRVLLVPAWEMPRMRNHQHCYSEWTGADFAPNLSIPGRPDAIECTLQPGDTLFLPIGWWHYVEGLDMTIGMSFVNFAEPNDFYSDYETYHAV